jgi:NAD(P)H-hydrate repair Nnr-like enzyme with NAD(P)H-hydrate dehydratase domain
MQDYWQRQASAKPLFPDLIWARPENKAQAGKLLIAGGNAHSLAAPATAYNQAARAGIGTARVLLPDSLQKTVGRVFEAGEYTPSTPSGSFGKRSLAELCALSAWADGVLLAGDFGRNSETAIMLEQYIGKYDGQLTVTHDALDYFTKSPLALLERPETLLVASFAQFQKLSIGAASPTPVTYEMDLVRLVEFLHVLTEKYPAAIITRRHDDIFVAAGGQVSTTKLPDMERVWRVKTAAAAAVWWLQNPSKAYAALTTSICDLKNSAS